MAVDIFESSDVEMSNGTLPMASVSLQTSKLDIVGKANSGQQVLECAAGSEAKPNQAEKSNENPQVGLQNGPLKSFHREYAVKMLTEKLKDLEGLNPQILDCVTETSPEHHEMMRKKLGDFRQVLRDLDDANYLTTEEKVVVERMLKDYQSAQEDSLEVRGSLANVDGNKTRGQRIIFDDDQVGIDCPTQETQDSKDGPLRVYHRGVAVRMLTDYLKDLEALNNQTIPDQIEIVQKRLGDYRKTLKDLDDANNREPNSQLTVDERVIVKRMLRDYQTALEDSLDVEAGNASKVSATDLRRDTAGEMIQQIEEVKDFEMTLSSMHLDDMVQSPWSLETINFPISEVSELQARFPHMLRLVADGLRVCEARVEELHSTLLHQVNVYKAQCTHLARALAGHVRNSFPVYRHILQTIPLMKSEEIEVGIAMGQRDRFRAVSFCIKSLAELDRTLGLAAELVSTCGKLEWMRTALRMWNAPAHPKIPRPSAFTITLRQCEWALDAVELFFHVLKKLLRSTVDPNWKDGVIFKWNNEDSRMVLQILRQPAPADATTADKEQSIGPLKVTQELEVRDRSTLLEDISSLCRRQLRRWFSKPDVQFLMAKFLEKKLRGPTPQATYLPFQSFSIDPTELQYQQYIDVGSVGMVAEYKWLGETVAVKSVRAPGESRAKFEDEAAILATVQHPNVVRLLGAAFQEDKETGMLVMELMESDLRTLIDKHMRHHEQPFPLIVAVDIMIQVAEAMHYIFAHRVLHRDLKAKNILVSKCKQPTRLFTFPDVDQLIRVEEYYVVKLADFGLAKCRPMTSHCWTLNTATTLWRAPEVFLLPDAESSRGYKWPADIYSFGMTCYEILTGGIPFDGFPNHSILGRIQRGERPNLEGKAPPGLLQLIKKCWDTRPENRPSINEILKQLWCCKMQIVFGSIQSLHMSQTSENKIIHGEE